MLQSNRRNQLVSITRTSMMLACYAEMCRSQKAVRIDSPDYDKNRATTRTSPLEYRVGTGDSRYERPAGRQGYKCHVIVMLPEDLSELCDAVVKYSGTDMQVTVFSSAGQHQVGHGSVTEIWIRRSTAIDGGLNTSTHQTFMSN